MRHMHAQVQVSGALPCNCFVLHVPRAQPCTSPNHLPLSITVRSIHTIQDTKSQQGSGPCWAYSPDLRLKSESKE